MSFPWTCRFSQKIVSDEEMVLLEAALAMASARSYLASSAIRPSHFHNNIRPVNATLSKRGFPGSKEQPDMEDSLTTRKKTRFPDSFLLRLRKNKGLCLSVSDLTDAEWCEKQTKSFLLGTRTVNEAMKNGTAHHAKLEEEVVKKGKVRVESVEDRWALKLLNFVTGANQLLFEGLTRELLLISCIDGIWMVGVIDEIRMPGTETKRNPLLVDMKTCVRPTLPLEPQRRNGRFQLMCYKRMWDNLAIHNFPTKEFFDYFSLNPYGILSEDVIKLTAVFGFPAKTIEDVVRYYTNTCTMLPPAQDQLLLRYESQQDNSLLGEDQFAYDFNWLKKQTNVSLEFWHGEREASYPPKEERWKCRCCQFATDCPINANLEASTPTSSSTNSTPR